MKTKGLLAALNKEKDINQMMKLLSQDGVSQEVKEKAGGGWNLFWHTGRDVWLAAYLTGDYEDVLKPLIFDKKSKRFDVLFLREVAKHDFTAFIEATRKNIFLNVELLEKSYQQFFKEFNSIRLGHILPTKAEGIQSLLSILPHFSPGKNFDFTLAKMPHESFLEFIKHKEINEFAIKEASKILTLSTCDLKILEPSRVQKIDKLLEMGADPSSLDLSCLLLEKVKLFSEAEEEFLSFPRFFEQKTAVLCVEEDLPEKDEPPFLGIKKEFLLVEEFLKKRGLSLSEQETFFASLMTNEMFPNRVEEVLTILEEIGAIQMNLEWTSQAWGQKDISKRMVDFFKKNKTDFFNAFLDDGRPAWWTIDLSVLRSATNRLPISKKMLLASSKEGEFYPFFVLSELKDRSSMTEKLRLLEAWRKRVGEFPDGMFDYSYVDAEKNNILHHLFKKVTTHLCSEEDVFFELHRTMSSKQLDILINQENAEGLTPFHVLINSAQRDLKSNVSFPGRLFSHLLNHVTLINSSGSFDFDLHKKASDFFSGPIGFDELGDVIGKLEKLYLTNVLPESSMPPNGQPKRLPLKI